MNTSAEIHQEWTQWRSLGESNLIEQFVSSAQWLSALAAYYKCSEQIWYKKHEKSAYFYGISLS